MNVLDIILLVFLATFMVAGWRYGLLRSVGSILGMIIGAYVAGNYYEAGAGFLMRFIGDHQALASVLAFGAIFLIISQVFGIIVYFIDKVFNLVMIIPFVKGFNRLLGFLFGFFEGALLIGTIFYVIARFPFLTFLQNWIQGSLLAGYLIDLANILSPLLPAALNNLPTHLL